MADIEILSADTANPSALRALLNGVPVLLILDSSARMRLADGRRELDVLAPGSQERIKDAAKRIVAMERSAPGEIIISALEF